MLKPSRIFPTLAVPNVVPLADESRIRSTYLAERYGRTARTRFVQRAADSLQKAREIVAAGNYKFAPRYAGLSWQARNESGYPYKSPQRYAYVESPAAFGFRFVGNVSPETRREVFADSSEGASGTGWLTDPFGDIFRDGTGLCWGVVYQLPARNGCARFVAGWQFGGTDSGPTLDLGGIFESAENCSYEGAQGNPAARDAARTADNIARDAAEQERDWQTAWQLGRIYADAAETIPAERQNALELLAERRKARSAGLDSAAICAAIRDSVRGHLSAIAEARETMRKAIAGESDGLCVYMDSKAQEAFCDAAGLQEFPA